MGKHFHHHIPPTVVTVGTGRKSRWLIKLLFAGSSLAMTYYMVTSIGDRIGTFGGNIGGVGTPMDAGYYDGIEYTSESKLTEIDAKPLIKAAMAGNLQQVDSLLEKIPVDARDGEDRTALIGAAYYGQDAACSKLLAAGANLTAKDKSGFNALDFAASRGLVDTVRQLLKSANRPDKKHYVDYSMIMQAAFSGRSELLPKTADGFAPVNRISAEGKSPLHVASSSGSVEMVNKLISYGADIDITTSDGQTPLHWAARSNKPSTIAELLKYSAAIDAVDNEGNTPLILAVMQKNKEAAKQLISQKADKTLRNKKGESAESIAHNNRFSEIYAILQANNQ